MSFRHHMHILRRHTAWWVSLAAVLVVVAEVRAWATDSLGVGRAGHSATILADGTVLVAGGGNLSGAIASAEVYDPVSGTFTYASDLATARYGHTATLLQDGTVLIAGGYNAIQGYLASAEIYDPKTGTFRLTGSLATARYSPGATELADGTVLVTGGRTSNSGDPNADLASAEIYNPVSGMFSPAGNMTTHRYAHTATALQDGAVLIAGGYNPVQGYLESAEIYDPVSATFSPTGSMGSPRTDATATALNDGTVLVVAGYSGGDWLASAEIYDPVSGTWR